MVCAGDLPEGRPAPLLMWFAMAKMGSWPAETVVKFDDTPPGLGEARNAGCWAVGLALSGNIAGLSPEDLAALPEPELVDLRAEATRQLIAGGANLVVDSIADLPAVMATIEERLAKGQLPN
ncbi:MAG: phosphonoacetaldehyde hydrolase [Rhodospirillales bacterium]|jgi:phosphonoacetaldehyde hydrolase|nr:phosphonoacetaldehyde hydrolase [Rhodospirillales bacterium]MDB5381829.1 phosphonoacetaldehyde hydrolase [Rhodospirillales bacterium]